MALNTEFCTPPPKSSSDLMLPWLRPNGRLRAVLALNEDCGNTCGPSASFFLFRLRWTSLFVPMLQGPPTPPPERRASPCSAPEQPPISQSRSSHLLTIANEVIPTLRDGQSVESVDDLF